MTSSITNSQFQFVMWLPCRLRDHNKPLRAGCPEQHGGQITKNQEGDTHKHPDWMAGLVTLTTAHYQEFPGELRRGRIGEGGNLAIWGLLPRREKSRGLINRRQGSSCSCRNHTASNALFQILQLHAYLVTSCSRSVIVSWFCKNKHKHR